MSWFKKKKKTKYTLPSSVSSAGITGPIIPSHWGKGSPYALSGAICYGVSSSVIISPKWEELDECEPDYNGDGVFNSDDLKEFERKVKATLADGHEVEVTTGEYYELNKMGKKLEDMNLEEYTEAILAVRL